MYIAWDDVPVPVELETGSSLLMLTPKEEAYVDLLRMRHVPLIPLPTTERCAPPPIASVTVSDDLEGINNDSPSNETPEDTVDATSPHDTVAQPVTERIIQSAADPNHPLVDVLPKIRDMVMRDRDLLEKGTKAFTSFIRAYNDHHSSFIFR
jgi:hypothetical protein